MGAREELIKAHRREVARKNKRRETYRSVELYAAAILQLKGETRKQGAGLAVDVGKQLDRAQQKLVKHGNGTFGRWCKDELKLNRTTVYKLLRVHEAFGHCQQRLLHKFDRSALYVLSEKGVPKEAIEQAVALGKSGQRITHKRATAIVGSVQPITLDASPLEQLQAIWKRASPRVHNDFKNWIQTQETKSRKDEK